VAQYDRECGGNNTGTIIMRHAGIIANQAGIVSMALPMEALKMISR
jgi:hypothetical protein